MKIKSKIVRKILILTVLCVGLAFALQTDIQTMAASVRCCETCPGYAFDGMPGGGDLEAYCNTQCDPANEACMQDCADGINQCWRNCRFCDNPGGDPPTPPYEPAFVSCSIWLSGGIYYINCQVN